MKIVREERNITKPKVSELRIGQFFLNTDSNQLCVVTEICKAMTALELKTGIFITFFDPNDCVGAIDITEIKYKEV